MNLNRLVERPPLLFRMLFPETMWRIHTKRHTVYLTFDDGPVPEITPWILDTLDHYGIKATFVIDMLKDDGLIAQHGEAFLKLTSKGGKAAKYGMKWHQRKLDVKDQAKIAGWLIGVVASITAILSFIIWLLC